MHSEIDSFSGWLQVLAIFAVWQIGRLIIQGLMAYQSTRQAKER